MIYTAHFFNSAGRVVKKEIEGNGGLNRLEEIRKRDEGGRSQDAFQHYLVGKDTGEDPRLLLLGGSAQALPHQEEDEGEEGGIETTNSNNELQGRRRADNNPGADENNENENDEDDKAGRRERIEGN
jgi:hypothetical protein